MSYAKESHHWKQRKKSMEKGKEEHASGGIPPLESEKEDKIDRDIGIEEIAGIPQQCADSGKKVGREEEQEG